MYESCIIYAYINKLAILIIIQTVIKSSKSSSDTSSKRPTSKFLFLSTIKLYTVNYKFAYSKTDLF